MTEPRTRRPKDRWCIARPPRNPEVTGFIVTRWFRWHWQAVLTLPRVNSIFPQEGPWRVMSAEALDETWIKVGWPW